MTNKTIELQAMEFVYDLGNSAAEFGFKPDEAWELSLASDKERSELEKQYRPTITTKVLPQSLTTLLGLVKNRLKQERSLAQEDLDLKTLNRGELEYLVAFNPARKRT